MKSAKDNIQALGLISGYVFVLLSTATSYASRYSYDAIGNLRSSVEVAVFLSESRFSEFRDLPNFRNPANPDSDNTEIDGEIVAIMKKKRKENSNCYCLLAYLPGGEDRWSGLSYL
ncbi:MAG: hypothetical protein JJT94_11990 [Bernardetiaceae bacterium]|nr:hypothetical protein [Bernardetiaceae bacterium]